MAGKKFRFSLQSVLTVRRHETERARQHLGQATSECRKQEEQVRHMGHRLMTCLDVVVERVDPASLQRQAAFRQDARQRYEQARSELALRQQRVKQARDHLRKTHTAEEALQVLREQEEAHHQKAQHDAEGAFFDEQAISGFFRKRAS